MSTTYYDELPPDYLEVYLRYAKAIPKPPALFAHTIALLLAGWSPYYISSIYSRVRDVYPGYLNQDYTDFDFPIVPEPSITSPNFARLRSPYGQTKAQGKSYYSDATVQINGLTPDQVAELRGLYLDFLAHRNYTPHDDYMNSPKFDKLGIVAKKILFYYVLGVSPAILSEALLGKHTPSTSVRPLQLIKEYYQWPIPMQQTRNQSSFYSIYSPQTSFLMRDLKDLFSPSKKNLESLSRTPHCTPFGPDLTLQRHLFRRKSYLTHFRELPAKAILLSPHQVKSSPSPGLRDAAVDPYFEELIRSRTPLTSDATH